MKNEGMAPQQEPPIRARLCCELLKQVMYIPGDVIELGVCEGATTVHLAEVLRKYDLKDKAYFACDTFEGLPVDEGELQKGECESSLAEFTENVNNDWVIPVRGPIESTLVCRRFPVRDPFFCFAFLDLDLESSTRFAIEWILPKMSLGSIIGFHDYGFHRTPGIKKAVDTLIPLNQFEEIPLGNTGDNIIFFRRVSL